MIFRPCIDIHNGKVKQIVGGSLCDQGNQASENFVAQQDAVFFANLYKRKGLSGGHIILLNPTSSEFYGQTKQQAIAALREFPKGMQVGGGITPENAPEFLEAGASHVIVTSYVFQNGELRMDKLQELIKAVSAKHLVLDLSCRKRGQDYYIVTDRWQKYTDVKLEPNTIHELSAYCDELLVHAVDVEGKAQGIEEDLAALLGQCCQIPATYAGGIHNFEDLARLKQLGQNRIDATIGSALTLFGGKMELDEVIEFMAKK